MRVVELTRTSAVAFAPPMTTEGVATKFVPVIVTLVPPAVEPVFGLMAVTVGAGGVVV